LLVSSCCVTEQKSAKNREREKKRKVMGVPLRQIHLRKWKRNKMERKNKKKIGKERYSSFISLFHLVNRF
jgi:hypothetical protein